MSLKKITFLLLCLPFLNAIASEGTVPKENKEKWVDSVLNSLTIDQKIGQLFMVAAYSNKDENHAIQIEKLISNYGIGGLIFFQGGPQRQVKLTNRFQRKSNIPLLIAIDGEWGLGMRLDSTLNFPKQMTLGALQDNSKIYEMGKEMARQCKRMGIHINFAPVIDINSNPKNPVIGYRSFGENKELVALKSSAYMKGMQHNGLIACAKHFPGHGDTDMDSHFGLPKILRDKQSLEGEEFYPFKKLIEDSIKSIMVAHLSIPALDNTPGIPASLSKKVVTGILKENMGFEGLIFTDALNMKGASTSNIPGDIELKAFLAGNDMLLFPENIEAGIDKIKLALLKRQIKQKEIDKRVKKILSAKYDAGLYETPITDSNNIIKDLNTFEARKLIKDIYSASFTQIRNKTKTIPFKSIDTATFFSLSIGKSISNSYFHSYLSKYAKFSKTEISEKASEDEFKTLKTKLNNINTLVVGLHKLSTANPNNFGLSKATYDFLEWADKYKNLVLVVFGTPYALSNFSNFNTVLCAYENNIQTCELIPQLLFGAIEASGKLPVSASEEIKAGLGFNVPGIDRIRYDEPEYAGLQSEKLLKIDTIVHQVIADHATPGCQIAIIKSGSLVYEKSFGYLSYDSLQKVENETIYDIASITKVAGTLQAIMYLHERGKLDIHDKASSYLPELANSNKADILITDILIHQAGLQPFIPYWKRTLKSPVLCEIFYCDQEDSNWFTHQVSPGFYSMKTMEDTLWNWIIQSDLIEKNRAGRYDYKYSDLGFYILKRIAEKLLEMPINEFLDKHFYHSLGLTHFRFLPKNTVPDSLIAPTEKDTLFRKSLIQGFVHDQGAAMLGGVAGHAGLFSNAADLAVLIYMNMHNGFYGGKYFLMPQTVPYFSQRHNIRNRRGYGWDKPYIWGNEGPTSKYASQSTFGHTGFTGTCVWADPEHDLVFVFLSNRVHPNADNVKLIKNNIRPKIHDVVYEAMNNFNPAWALKKGSE